MGLDVSRSCHANQSLAIPEKGAAPVPFSYRAEVGARSDRTVRSREVATALVLESLDRTADGAAGAAALGGRASQ